MTLTKGNIYKQMLALCGPLILGNILQQFYNTIDAWIIGRYSGQLEFAAVGIAGSAMNLFLFFIIGICTGISVIMAQLYGAGDMDRLRMEHYQTLVCGIIGTIMIAAIAILCLNPLLHVLGTPSNLFSYTRTYLFIVFLGLPFSFLYNFYNAILRATGNVRVPLYILAAAVLINLLADLYLVRNLHMGIRGAAIATVLSQILSVIASVIYMIARNKNLCFKRTDMNFSMPLLKKTVSVSIVTGIHQASLYIGKLFVQGAVNSAGTDMITAFTATSRIEGFINSFGDSGAAATSVIVAQSFGAHNNDRIKKAARSSAVVLTVFGVVCSLILFITAPYSVSFMLGTNTGTAFSQGKQYLEVISSFYIFCFLGNTFAGYFDGIGKTYIPFIGAAGHITLRAILSWLLIGRLGLTAVAIACGIGWILADALWFIIFRRSFKEQLHIIFHRSNSGNAEIIN